MNCGDGSSINDKINRRASVAVVTKSLIGEGAESMHTIEKMDIYAKSIEMPQLLTPIE